MKKSKFVLIATLIILSLTGCGTAQTMSTPSVIPTSQQTSVAATATASSSPVKASAGTQVELSVAAASDLTKAFNEVGAAFEKANSCKVTFTYGSTGTQTEQIANGAPFDLFAAANIDNIDQLDQKGLIASDTKQLYALGRIGIATMKNGKITVSSMEDLLKSDVKVVAIANPDHAPYGLAAKQALETAGIWGSLEPKLVYGKNITDTVSYLTSGNADAAFIALSLNDTEKFNFTMIDANMHKPLKQAIAVLKSSKNQDLAKSFITYVLSPDGQKIMNKYGFVLPEA